MPSMSREYCKKTPIRKMGFSQKASCKAQEMGHFSVIQRRKRSLILLVMEPLKRQKKC